MNKDNVECPVPEKVMRNPERLRLLSTAIDAYKAKQAMDEEALALFGEEKISSREILDKLATGFNDDRAQRRLRELETNVDSGDLVLTEMDDKVLFFVSPKLARLIDRQRTDQPGVGKLLRLIEQGHLQGQGSIPQSLLARLSDRTETGRRFYCWIESPSG